ncbi:unnamed protein product, partial [Ixodes hexagonus]
VTGDLGYYDEEGNIYFVERIKEMIKCMDNQLAPAELEELLLSHDAVKEVVVVGVPNPKYGEAPAACVAPLFFFHFYLFRQKLVHDVKAK